MFSERNSSPATQNHGLAEGAQGDKAFPSLVLLLAQLSAFIEQTAIPIINTARIHLTDLYLIFDSLEQINFFVSLSFPFISSGYALKIAL